MKMRKFKPVEPIYARQVKLIEGNKVLFDDDEEDSQAVELPESLVTRYGIMSGDYVIFDKSGNPQSLLYEGIFESEYEEVFDEEDELTEE